MKSLTVPYGVTTGRILLKSKTWELQNKDETALWDTVNDKNQVQLSATSFAFYLIKFSLLVAINPRTCSAYFR